MKARRTAPRAAQRRGDGEIETAGAGKHGEVLSKRRVPGNGNPGDIHDARVTHGHRERCLKGSAEIEHVIARDDDDEAGHAA
jgi:hypothetical protein